MGRGEKGSQLRTATAPFPAPPVHAGEVAKVLPGTASSPRHKAPCKLQAPDCLQKRIVRTALASSLS